MPASSLRRDVISAYAASLSRIASWALVTALVFRRSPSQFALLALVRGTIGILNYAALGLLPAMIRVMAEVIAVPAAAIAPEAPAERDTVLGYATPQTRRADRHRRAHGAASGTQRAYSTGMLLAAVTALVGLAAAYACGGSVGRVYALGGDALDLIHASYLVVMIGGGIAVRWLGDPASAALQTHGRIAVDNLIQATGELVWVGWVAAAFRTTGPAADLLQSVGSGFFLASIVLISARSVAAWALTDVIRGRGGVDIRLLRTLLVTGSLITLAQLADYLYSPTDYLLINHLLTAPDLANYAPAVQVDGGLMVLVSGLAAVLLPRAAVAHVAGDRAQVRWYYVRGTLATGAMLAVAGVIVWFASPWIFRLWLHDSMPGTRAILPLVLVHTVLGGSSAVGRSILLGIGKAKPLTVAVLIAGGVNVACSYAFVRYLHWGLAGIVLGTIVAVVGRCALWMPWYVLRELRRGDVREEAIGENRDAMVVDPGV